MHNPDDRTSAGEVLAPYLRARANDFLRALRLHTESNGNDTSAAEEAARALRAAARRISGTLHTFRPLVDGPWADGLRTELAWLSSTLAQEHACTSRLVRLVDALSRLTGGAGVPAPRGSSGAPSAGDEAMRMGAARAGALLERRLTLSRAKAHSAALEALGSSRFHAVADAVALLASEVPLGPAATSPAEEILPASTDTLERRLLDAVAALPMAPAVGGEHQDAPWHQVRLLLRLHRYALEVRSAPAPELYEAATALDRHRDAAEAAAAAATAARTPRIAPATAYTLGVLHADQRHEVGSARHAFHLAWRRTAVAAR
ncbi:CHAD domain-containing protein [Streptomyces sp. TRM49041]|uniref:CHAD domain-containing protein n=1 Tax=Streptomyces sp. TRM49041 TaxID=2603216 RepID=UPI0011F04000|nr:CHAD domain-containing protein [Streptomyces sp. TRM49041]